MANKRVVDLPQAEKMLDGDILHIIQNGEDKQIPANKVGGDGIKKADTKAEAEAMVESGDLENRGIVLVENDGDGVPSPSELAEIRRDINQLQSDTDELFDNMHTIWTGNLQLTQTAQTITLDDNQYSYGAFIFRVVNQSSIVQNLLISNEYGLNRGSLLFDAGNSNFLRVVYTSNAKEVQARLENANASALRITKIMGILKVHS